MTTDPNGWFLTSQALDQKDTATALAAALPNEDDLPIDLGDPAERCNLADDLAIGLARAGYALVRLTPEHGTPLQVPFLSRKED